MVVGGESQSLHRGFVSLQGNDFLWAEAGQIPKPNESFETAATRSQKAIARAKSQGVNFTRFRFQDCLFMGFAAAQVPQSDGTVHSSRSQGLPVGGEGQSGHPGGM